jgi:A/G-specific adenine glycosylase
MNGSWYGFPTSAPWRMPNWTKCCGCGRVGVLRSRPPSAPSGAYYARPARWRDAAGSGNSSGSSGIGRSTAGAILALAAGQRQLILDGNVKRLLARFAAVDGWPGQSRVLAALWDLAERYTPDARVADIHQAMMDWEPWSVRRAGRAAGPVRWRRVAWPTPWGAKPIIQPLNRAMRCQRELPGCCCCARRMAVLLERRPPVGVWGGLWSFPECPPEVDVADWCRERLGLAVTIEGSWGVVRHSFSHFHLDITPVSAVVTGSSGAVMAGERFVWYNTRELDSRGVAAPVRRLLATLASEW